jgi:hypothetical protein
MPSTLNSHCPSFLVISLFDEKTGVGIIPLPVCHWVTKSIPARSRCRFHGVPNVCIDLDPLWGLPHVELLYILHVVLVLGCEFFG